MSVSFSISKQFTKDLEGGYWNDPSAGHTYAGITWKYYSSWKGWKRLFALAVQKFGSIANVPRYTKFKDALLETEVDNFYISRFWNGLMNAGLFRNQDIANLTYDFLVHKENDAIAVFNYAVKQIAPKAVVDKNKITPQAISIANSFQDKFYQLLRNSRAAYYQNPKSIPGTSLKKFSTGLMKAFLKRVDKFPLATVATNAFLNPFSFIKLPFSL